jgi:hypothetical protein
MLRMETSRKASVMILSFIIQSKDLRMILDAAWYVPNTATRTDLQTPTIKGEIR